MSSDPQRRRRPSRARIMRAMLATLCAVSLTLTPLIAPSASLAQSSPGSGQLVRTSSAPLPPPDKPPGGRGGGGGEGRFPCRGKQCLEIVKQFCKEGEKFGGCAELAQKFLDTKKGDPRNVLGNDKNNHVPDLAFQDGCSAFWVGSRPALLISWWAVIVDHGSPECKRRISFCFSRRSA